MNCLYRIRWALGIVAMATLCVVASSVPAGAQAVTTGTLSGNVVDQ